MTPYRDRLEQGEYDKKRPKNGRRKSAEEKAAEAKAKEEEKSDA